MKRLISVTLLAAASLWISACGGPAANNAPANNSNANTAKPTAAAPTVDALLAMEKAASEAYAKGDGAYFEGILSDKAVMSMGKNRMGKADIVSMIKTAKCEFKDGVKLSEPQMSKINEDTYAFTFKSDSTGSCTENGKSVEIKPTRAATVWVRNGEKWQAVWHGENEIMGAPAGDKKADDKTAEVKKEEPKKDDKAAATKPDAKPAANASSAANTAATAAPAKLTPSANTDALTKAHAAGWEAFRNKDAKAFEGTMTSSFSGVGPDGSVFANRDAAIKEWTGAGTMKCEGITKTSFTEGFAQAASPTVEILMGKGNADGKCNGQPNGDLWQTAVYVKEGDAWKLAFMFESMPMPGA
ncbi:MAG: nuclear transport factor 2 family protein [Chloracidobacterium sp.]|nr:nuclear transport factor 2 family protein [Chloracidobacterium sp.]